MIETMEKYGGSFVKALANAMRHADANNYSKLVSSFSNYVSEYRAMAKKEKLNECPMCGRSDDHVHGIE